MTHFRSINLRTQVVKIHHAFMHEHAKTLMGVIVHATQCGGVPGRGCDMAGASLCWTLSCAQAMDIDVQILFIDIQAAFYSVIHDLLVDAKSSSESVDDLLRRIGIPLILQGPLVEMLKEPGRISKIAPDMHNNELMQQALIDTWFSTRNSTSMASARTGTGPGAPWPIICFPLLQPWCRRR